MFHLIPLMALVLLLAACGSKAATPPGGTDASTDRAADLPIAGDVPSVSDVSTSGCTSAAECNDGLACSEDSCMSGTCSHTPINALCGMGMNCDLRRGCLPAPACGTDADCADMDPCTVAERCDPASRRCESHVLDGDGDGIPPVSCGGGDCNDNNPFVRPGVPEACDGRDQNCNGQIDEMLDAMACPDHQSCLRGHCECNPSSLCGTTCADFMTDAMHCGGCDHRCPPMSSCSGGRCTCPPSQPDLCGDSCTTLMSSSLNCGACGNRCPDDGGVPAGCFGGRCQCSTARPDVCAGHCVSLADSNEHCGACGRACSGVCAGGTCGVPAGLAVGGEHQCVRFSSGGLKCWGSNASGQTGLPGATVDAPATVPGLSGVVHVAAGGSHTCAVVAGGMVRCFGANERGQLGTASSTTPTRTPTLVPGVSGATQVVAGDGHTCVLLGGGTVQCWGDNESGQLGIGSRDVRSGAIAVAGLSGVTALAAGINQTCALMGDGTVRCWGEVGLEMVDSSRPVAIPGLTEVVEIAAGRARGIARRRDGTVIFWGTPYDLVGAWTTEPRQVFAGAADIAMGPDHACLRLMDGSVQCWGSNDDCHLGNPMTGLTCRLDGRTAPCFRYPPDTAPELRVLGIMNPVELGLGGSRRQLARFADGTVRQWAGSCRPSGASWECSCGPASVVAF